MSSAWQWQGQAQSPWDSIRRSLWGWGSPGSLTSTSPAGRAFHVLWPPICLVSNSYFYPRSFQSTALLGDMGQQEGPRLYPSKSRLSLPAEPLAEGSHSVFKLTCDPSTG